MFLTDGGQPASAMLDRLVAFVDGARQSLDLAVYDAHLDIGGDRLIGALDAAEARGVRVRAVYNDDHPKHAAIPPPTGAPSLLAQLAKAVPSTAIPGIPDLMHDKYIVRDADTVWTGSTNWTDDAWSRMENLVVTIPSADLAAAFTRRLRTALAETTRDRHGHLRRRSRHTHLRRRRPQRARLVLAGPRPVDRASRRPPSRPGDAPYPHLLAGDHVGTHLVDAGRSARRSTVQRARDGRRSADARSVAPVGRRRAGVVEDAARRACPRLGSGCAKAVAPVSSGATARLHARQGGGVRRRRADRLVQPQPLRRDERRERARDRERTARRRVRRVLRAGTRAVRAK